MLQQSKVISTVLSKYLQIVDKDIRRPYVHGWDPYFVDPFIFIRVPVEVFVDPSLKRIVLFPTIMLSAIKYISTNQTFVQERNTKAHNINATL